MSSNNHFQGPFIKGFHAAEGTGLLNRLSNNPAYPSPYEDVVPTPNRRIYLVIQNQGTVEINLHLSDEGTSLKLYAGQSISFENFNGGFFFTNTDGDPVDSPVSIVEAFA